MASFLAALRADLKSVPGLADLEEVYTSGSGANPVFPFIILNLLFEETFDNISDASYKESHYQVTILAMNGTQAEQLGREARQHLKPKSGQTKLVFDDGYEMTRWLGRYIGPYEETWGMPGGDNVWKAHFDVVFQIGEN
jgi:hypothetical protein